MPTRIERAAPTELKLNATAYWLVPAAAERELFGKIIQILGKEFRAPLFEPHLTLVVRRGNKHSPKAILRGVKASPIQLSIREIGFSSKFTKSLFVRFDSNKALEKLVGHLAHATGSRVKFVSDPHLSLLYKKLTTPVKKDLASTIHFPLVKVSFDSIKAISCRLPIRTATDIDAWKDITLKHLSGP
jgi:hypothetical protein